jgi:hypothetical protein
VAARIFAAVVIHLQVTVCYRRWVTAKAASTTAMTPAMIVTTTEWVAQVDAAHAEPESGPAADASADQFVYTNVHRGTLVVWSRQGK